MNRTTFTLADVLTLITSLAFGFICFLSIYFYTLGNTKYSVMIAAIITIILFILALGAKLLKKTSRNFKSAYITEKVCVVFFSLIYIALATTLFSHFFVVSAQKRTIQKKLNTSIIQAEKMFSEYENYAKTREGLYKKRLQSAVYSKNTNPTGYKSFGFDASSISDDKQIEKKMFTFHTYLFPSKLEEMKKKHTAWLHDSRKIITNWHPIGIVNVVNSVEKESTKWLNELVGFSNVDVEGEAYHNFDYKLTFNNVNSYFTTTDKPTLLAIVLGIASYFLMLFSYFITKRHSKFPGLKRLFSKGETTSNEL